MLGFAIARPFCSISAVNATLNASQKSKARKELASQIGDPVKKPEKNLSFAAKMVSDGAKHTPRATKYSRSWPPTSICAISLASLCFPRT